MEIKRRKRKVDIFLNQSEDVNTIIINNGEVVLIDDITSNLMWGGVSGNDVVRATLTIIKMANNVKEVKFRLKEDDKLVISNNDLNVRIIHDFHLARMVLEGKAKIKVIKKG